MRLLLVEDDDKVAAFVARGLRAEGYAIDRARDVAEGKENLSASSYDLLIMDLNLPGRSGSDLLRDLRMGGSGLPVLVLSARDSLADKVSLFEMGADDYLTKPFAFAELLVRVKALLRRGPTERSNELVFGDLKLDRSTRRVERGSLRLNLTAKEFALLEYLMLNEGRVLSRTMIVEHVWDQSFEGLTNIVDVYIRQLRKKVDLENEKPLISTVRGMGYGIGLE